MNKKLGQNIQAFQYSFFLSTTVWITHYFTCTYQGAELSPPLFKLCKLDCFLCNAQWLSSDLKRVFVNSFYFQIALVFILHNWSRFLWLLLWTRRVAESEASEYDIFQKNALRMVIRRWFLHGFTLPKPPLGKKWTVSLNSWPLDSSNIWFLILQNQKQKVIQLTKPLNSKLQLRKHLK